MLMASCNTTSFSGSIDSKKIEEDLRFKRRRLLRRMTSAQLPLESNGGIDGLLTPSSSHDGGAGSGNYCGRGGMTSSGSGIGGLGGGGGGSSGGTRRGGTWRFNIRGTRFIVQRATFEQVNVLPCRLTALTADDAAFDKCLNEFYFDRNPHIFGSIVDYYAQGEMHLPENMCVFAVKKELEFWELDADVLASCCWNRYCKAEEDQRMLHSVVSEWFASDTDLDQDTLSHKARHAPLKERVWLLMNEPHTSLAAKIWSVVLVLMVVLSIVVLSLETVLQLRQAPDAFWETLPNITHKKLVYILENSEPHDALVWIEIVTLIVLTFEFVARLLSAPDKRVFCRGLLNIADLLSIIPIWVMIALELSDVDFSRKEKGAVVFAYYFMMLLRMLRLFRLFKLVKHYKTLKILLMAIKASYKELILLIILLTMGVIIYANVMFFVEVEYDNFMSIPEGFWWAIITMTTVGYGDLYPKSALGQVIGSACAITGILVIALPVPVIANNFHAFYASAQAVQRMREREEKEIMKEIRQQQQLSEQQQQQQQHNDSQSQQQQQSVASITKETNRKAEDDNQDVENGVGSIHDDDDAESMSKFPESLTIDNLISKSPETFALTEADNNARV